MFYRDRIILILQSREHCVSILSRIRCSRIIALVSLGESLGAGLKKEDTKIELHKPSKLTMYKN